MDVFNSCLWKYYKFLLPESGNGDLGFNLVSGKSHSSLSPRTQQDLKTQPWLCHLLMLCLWRNHLNIPCGLHPTFLPPHFLVPLNFHTVTQLVTAKNCLGQKLLFPTIPVSCAANTQKERFWFPKEQFCTFREHNHDVRHTSQILPPHLQGELCWGDWWPPLKAPPAPRWTGPHLTLVAITRRGMHQQMEGEEGG